MTHPYKETPTKLYSERHDAFYDPTTDNWLDTKCDDVTCEYCSDRPLHPSQVADHTEFPQWPRP